ncbi:extracellular solute-binding protein [Paenibacillus eucommiae]|nr:extracellular solute-binding protein [Paenibacillus eucommiae]
MSLKVKLSLLLLLAVMSIGAACTQKTNEDAKVTSSPGVVSETGGDSTAQPADSSSADYGDTGGLALPIAKDETELRAITYTYADSPIPENFFTKELAKRTNLDLQIQRFKATDPTEELGLLVASNNLPDIVGTTTSSLVSKLGVEAFVPINKYLDILPNFKKVLDENPQIMKSNTSSDGNLYVFDYLSYKISPRVNYGIMIRKDILEKNGIAVPKGPDQYYEVFKKLKQIYPDSYPFINYYGADILQLLSQSWGTFNKMFVPDGKDAWEYGPVSNEYKDMLVYLAKLYKEGLMDPEFMTSKEDRFNSQVLQADKGFAFQGWFGRMDSLQNTAKEKVPEFELAPADFMGPKGKVMAEPKVLDYGISVSSSSKHVKEALQLIDYLYSPSGSTLVTMGVEGVTFHEEADGTITYPEFQGQAVTRVELEKKYGLTMTGFMETADPRSAPRAITPKFQEVLDLLKDPFWEEEQPVMHFTEEEVSRKTPLEDALLKAVLEYSTKVIMGTESIEKWDEWLKKNESIGYKKLVDIYNTAYTRYKEQ